MAADVLVIFERHGSHVAAPPDPIVDNDGVAHPVPHPDPCDGDCLWDWNLTNGGGASLDYTPPTFRSYDEAFADVQTKHHLTPTQEVQDSDNMHSVTGSAEVD